MDSPISNSKIPPLQPESESEISLLEILNFIKSSWKTIGLGSFLGLVCAIGYLVVTSPMYEATAQIRMAQYGQISTNIVGALVEDPASLISRLQIPSNFSSDVIKQCGYQDKQQASLVLTKDLKFSIPKGVANTVELKVLSDSPTAAMNCAQAVYEQIALLQEQSAKPLIEEAHLKLASDNERIEAAKKLIAKADQSGSAISVAYISARDELTYFLTDREKMNDLINSLKNRGAKLSSPIYVSDKPVTPKKSLSVAVGFLAGLLLGLLFALGRKFVQQSSLSRGQN